MQQPSNIKINLTQNSKNSKTISKSNSFMDWLTAYDSLVIFGGFSISIVITVILTGIFQAGPAIRDNVLYNACGAMAMAIGFIYIIFTFMGSTIIILGKTFDIGMFIYISIVFFIIFVLGN